MISIGVIAKGQQKYYLNLAREDYYLAGGEPPGQWWGRGAARFGLDGKVKAEDLTALFSGKLRDGTQLVQNADSKERRPGFDLTFSAPKSVSVLWAVAPEEMRKQIAAAHRDAVHAALDYIQDEAAYTRSGKGGTRVHRADIAVAMFEHGTSRALDPQLHTHALLINVGVGKDGEPRALVHPAVYGHAMTAGALYRAELAHQLERRLQLVIEREGIAFKVAGVSEALCKEMSKRRAQIEAELGEAGLETARAAQRANLKTRETKTDVPSRQSLHAEWCEAGRRFGFSTEQAAAIRQMSGPDRAPAEVFNEIFSRGVERLTDSQAHFTGQELLRAVAVESPGQGLGAADIRKRVRAAIENSPQLMPLTDDPVQRRKLTTPEIWNQEEKLLSLADTLNTQTTLTASVRSIMRAIDRHDASPEHARAVQHLTSGIGGNLRIMEGFAGTGKSSVFRVTAEIWKKAGYEPVGITISGKAATELHTNSGMPTLTFAMLQKLMENDATGFLKHEARTIWRSLSGQVTFTYSPLKLKAKNVIVVDEASMLTTEQMTWLLNKATKAGASVILAGDRSQLQAIGQGGAFSALADRFGKTELQDILRQKDPAYRQAVIDLAEGNAHKALDYFDKAGMLHFERTRDLASRTLVQDWKKNELHRDLDESLIFTGTKQEAKHINMLCQDARRDAGQLGRVASIRHNSERFYINDRVMFTAPARKLGVVNGQMGVVEGINPFTHSIIVRLGHDWSVTVPLFKYRGVALGYAVTTHKGQGSTVERAYVLAGGTMQHKEIAYVQASRARERTDLYFTGVDDVVEREEIVRQMKRSREKTLAHSIRANEQEQSYEF